MKVLCETGVSLSICFVVFLQIVVQKIQRMSQIRTLSWNSKRFDLNLPFSVINLGDDNYNPHLCHDILNLKVHPAVSGYFMSKILKQSQYVKDLISASAQRKLVSQCIMRHNNGHSFWDCFVSRKSPELSDLRLKHFLTEVILLSMLFLLHDPPKYNWNWLATCSWIKEYL